MPFFGACDGCQVSQLVSAGYIFVLAQALWEECVQSIVYGWAYLWAALWRCYRLCFCGPGHVYLPIPSACFVLPLLTVVRALHILMRHPHLFLCASPFYHFGMDVKMLWLQLFGLQWFLKLSPWECHLPKLSFGMVFAFGKLLKQSNVLVVKITRFGVLWVKLLSASKVNRDQVLSICQWLNLVLLQISACLSTMAKV